MALIHVHSIRQKITILCGLFLVLTVASIVTYSAISVRKSAIENAKNQALATAHEQAASVRGELDEALDSAKTLASTLSAVKDENVQLDITREAVNGILRIILESNPRFVGVYTCWEPDRFDEMDVGFADTDGHDASGRLIPYWYRDADGSSVSRPLVGYDNEQADGEGKRPGDYYLIPKQTMQACILNPQLREVEADGQRLILPLSVPIIANDTFHATVGIDLAMDQLQKHADALDIYNHSAQIFVFSQDGTLISATGSPNKVGQKLATVFEDAPQVIDQVQRDEQSAEFVGDWLRVTVPIDMDQAADNWGIVIRIPQSNILADASSMMWMQVWLGVGCVAVTIVLLWLAATSITRPIRRINELLKDIAQGEGDLTRRLAVNSNDEIGEQAKWFNTFVQKIHDVIVEVTRSADEVVQSATRIAASSSGTAEQMRAQANQVQSVASAIEEMAASVEEVAKKSTEATETAQLSRDKAAAGGDIVGETVQSIKSISASVEESALAINELGKRGDQIGQIIGVINDIADQTNLLALNAAIEAARAGEYGRGFAVVADEVRKLADRTTAATAEVADSISAIQDETSKAVQRMNTGSECVEHGVGMAENAGQSLSEIVSGSDTVLNMIRSIASATEQQSATATDITTNVESINNLIGKSTDATVSSAMEADEMSSKAQHLQQLVSQFKVDNSRNTGGSTFESEAAD